MDRRSVGRTGDIVTSIERIVIVGAGLAGARAAEFLRKEGYAGSITLLGDEPDRPYIRPPLSKGYLRGEEELDKVFVHGADFYDANSIDLRTESRVTAIDPVAREVELGDSRRLPFDRLLLATGARPRSLDVEGADLPGVAYLRTREDADRLRADAGLPGPAVVIGAGWIGCEVASSLRMLGHEVAMVAPGALPLERVLGAELGTVYRDLHAENGVTFHLGQRVERLTGTRHVEAVVLGDGRSIPASLVVVGVGVEPRADLASAAGLDVGDGVETSATLETSATDIFAAGDVASAWHPFYGRRLRVEHWANARFQGAAVAKTILGDPTPYDRIPYFYSDQYDLAMEYRGFATSWDRVVIRGDLAGRTFLAFWLASGRVVAALNANIHEVGKPIERLIRSQAVVDEAALGDQGVALDDLVAAAEPA